MNKLKKQQIEQFKRDNLFKICNSREEIAQWIQLYFGWKLTKGFVDPQSNSSPVDAIWEIYKAARDNTGDITPGYILLSSRESFKTLSASILEILLLLHFKGEIGHMAAIRSQSEVAMGYITKFLFILKPYLDAHGWVSTSENKTLISYSTPTGETPKIKIVVCSRAGANAFHCTYFFVDEIDVIQDPGAYEESKSIPGSKGKIFPITIKLSTRKYAFGLMANEVEQAAKNRQKVLRWNMLDISERCDEKIHKPELPKITRYVKHNLPLVSLTEEEFKLIDITKHHEYDKIEAFAGCADCSILPVCKTNIAKRNKDCSGGFYKPLSTIKNAFLGKTPEYCEAQILCWKPSAKGLVYPRFDDGNIVSIEQAYFELTGIKAPHVTFEVLVKTLQDLGISSYCGIDWGYRHKSAFIVGNYVPNGDFWITDTYAESELELEDLVRVGLELKDKFDIIKFFPDPAYPMYAEVFNKRGLKCEKFTKDVMGGIELVRGKVVDATGRRKLKILSTENNQILVEAMKTHHFLLDSQGNITKKPDDEELADVCFVPGTMITTKSGSKPIEKICCSDYVLTHKGNWKRVKTVMSRKYEGDLIQIRSLGKPLLECTPNHPVFTNKMLRSRRIENGKQLTGQRRPDGELRFEPAEQLSIPKPHRRKHDPISTTFFPIPKQDGLWTEINVKELLPNWKEEGDFLVSQNKQFKYLGYGEELKVPKKIELTEEMCFLIGYYVAEGSLGGNRSQIGLSGHEDEKKVMKLLEKVAEKIGARKVTWNKAKGESKGRTINFNHRGLYNFLKTLKKEEDKKFPDLTLNLSIENTKAMLFGYLMGDGCLGRGQRGLAEISSNSISHDISFMVYYILIKIGYRPTLRLAEREGRWEGPGLSGVVDKDQWIVGLNSKDTVQLLKEINKNDLIREAFEDKKINTREGIQSSVCQFIDFGGLISPIHKLDKTNYSGLVFNLEVEDDNSYVANCSAVHNCDATRYLGQNVFKREGKGGPKLTTGGVPEVNVNKTFMQQEIEKHATNDVVLEVDKKKKKGPMLIW